MATKKEEVNLAEQMTVVSEKVDDSWKGPVVEVFIPELENTGDNGLKVDQYEHVSLANEMGEKIYYVRRGERVEVPVPVFLALKARYPKI